MTDCIQVGSIFYGVLFIYLFIHQGRCRCGERKKRVRVQVIEGTDRSEAQSKHEWRAWESRLECVHACVCWFLTVDQWY